jgi:hypothetical protein
LHDEKDQRVFDSVVVVTDRRVLDQQLQANVYEFEHKQGVVQKIDENAQQLAGALASGTPIVITTLQKFPFVMNHISGLPSRRYALIVDEAHSSQTGESARHMKEVLAARSLEDAEKEESVDPAALADIVGEACEARNGWKVILGRCSPSSMIRRPAKLQRQATGLNCVSDLASRWFARALRLYDRGERTVEHAHRGVAEFRADLLLDLAEHAKTIEQGCLSALAEPHQLRASVGGVGDPFKHSHDDEFIDELSGGLLRDTESAGEIGEAGTLKIDVGQQRCVRGPNRLLRALP